MSSTTSDYLTLTFLTSVSALNSDYVHSESINPFPSMSPNWQRLIHLPTGFMLESLRADNTTIQYTMVSGRYLWYFTEPSKFRRLFTVLGINCHCRAFQIIRWRSDKCVFMTFLRRKPKQEIDCHYVGLTWTSSSLLFVSLSRIW